MIEMNPRVIHAALLAPENGHDIISSYVSAHL